MHEIRSVNAIKVLNSRGDWTIRTTLTTKDGLTGYSIVPEGASKGENEAFCLDSDNAIKSVAEIGKHVNGKQFSSQREFDDFLINFDGTENKSKLGGNAILSLSIAFARAGKTIDPTYNKPITPLFNILNGGKHAQNKLSFQEFMVIPSKKYDILKCIEIGVTVYKSLKQRLEKDGYSTGVGDEGGFAPLGFTVKKALSYITDCASENYEVGEDVFLGMDVAAGSFFIDGEYFIGEENLTLSTKDYFTYIGELIESYKLIYIEDPIVEGDVSGWRDFTKQFGDRLMISADDLVVTNPHILSSAIKEKLANTVIVKPNQVGTISETLDFVKMSKKAGWQIAASHRSGDTEDPFIADLACSFGADFVKFGAPDRGERTSKYNRLLELFSKPI